MNGKNGDTYMFQPDIETMGRDQLAELQLKKLKKTVKHAYDNVALYTERLDAAGIKPGDLKSLDDFAGFPLTVKEDLRTTYPLGMFAVPRPKSRASTPPRGPPESPPSSLHGRRPGTCGPTSWRAPWPAPGRAPATSCKRLWLRPVHGGLGFHDGAERLGRPCCRSPAV